MSMLAEPSAPMQASAVYAIIHAYGRPTLLARVLNSLREQGPALRGVFVVNNSCDDSTKQAAAGVGMPVRVLTPDCNLGTAGGIAFGLRNWLSVEVATHVWILDDDVIAMSGALAAMLAALTEAGAEAAAPLLTDRTGTVQWLPGLYSHEARRASRGLMTPEEFRLRCGEAPLRWHWALWASLLVSRRAVLAAGLPRLDLWSQFSDIEYTLRLTARFKGVLAPKAVCRHLPPPAAAGAAFDVKLYSALQNGSFVSTRLRHGRRALRHLPGLHYRYLRHYRWERRAWGRMVTAFFTGAVLGRPSGRTSQAAEVRHAEAALGRVEPHS